MGNGFQHPGKITGKIEVVAERILLGLGGTSGAQTP